MLDVVGSSLKMVKLERATPNMSKQGGQTHATCCAQQYCNLENSPKKIRALIG